MRTLLLSASLALSVSIAAQAPPIAWEQALGGSSTEYAQELKRTPDGGCVVVSHTNSNDGDVTGQHGNNDVWITKLDALGALTWQMALGGSAADLGRSIAATSDGGYIITGQTSSNDGDVTGAHGQIDIWVVKLDAGGSLQWQKALGGSSNEVGYDAQQTIDGGYIIAGYTTSTDGDVTMAHGLDDAWLVKLDAAGGIEWQRTYGGTIWDYAQAVLQTSDGGYLFAGKTNSNDGDVSGNHGNQDAWLVKVDATGNIQWQTCYGGTMIDTFMALDAATGGGFVAAGNTASEDGDVAGWHPAYDCGNPRSDAWVVKVNDVGDIEWQRCLGGTGAETMSAVRHTPVNTILAAGTATNADGDVTYVFGSNDYWVVQLDASGIIDWQTSLGGSSSEQAFGVDLLNDGGIGVAGGTYSVNGQVTGHNGVSDSWVVKLTGEYNTITGTIFCDLNSNGTQDVGELPVPYRSVRSIGTGEVGWSRQDGTYPLVVLGSGNFTVEPMVVPNYASVPATHSASFVGFQQTDAGNDFALQPTAAVNDITVALTPTSAFRPGFPARYTIQYGNVGTTLLAPTVAFHPDVDFNFDSASVAPSSITADSIVWTLSALQPFEVGNISVYGTVNLNATLGSSINSSASITPIIDDADPTNNSAALAVTVIGSYDPNDILVDRATLEPTDLADPPYLNYIIRFQNTGTDTAFTVRVQDPVPTNAQLGSFQFVAASHPVSITHHAASNVLNFRFDNILLADSNTNEPASHGYVHYRIKPLSTLLLGDSILNQAAIFFDYNLPVFTNTAYTVIETSTGAGMMAMGDHFLLSPNPASGALLVSTRATHQQATLIVTDIASRELIRERMIGATHTLDMADLPRGVYTITLRNANGSQAQRLVLE